MCGMNCYIYTNAFNEIKLVDGGPLGQTRHPSVAIFRAKLTNRLAKRSVIEKRYWIDIPGWNFTLELELWKCA